MRSYRQARTDAPTHRRVALAAPSYSNPCPPVASAIAGLLRRRCLVALPIDVARRRSTGSDANSPHSGIRCPPPDGPDSIGGFGVVATRTRTPGSGRQHHGQGDGGQRGRGAADQQAVDTPGRYAVDRSWGDSQVERSARCAHHAACRQWHCAGDRLFPQLRKGTEVAGYSNPA
jgi:hypothetical protein